MIPDFIGAIYLWVIDKISGPYPVWRARLVPVCLFILFIAVSVLYSFVGAKDEPPLPPIIVVEYAVEIEALKLRLATAEANILALSGTVNKIIEAINRIEAPPSLGHLATKGELELVRLKVQALKKELEEAGMIHDRVLSTLNLEIDELKQAVEELEEEVTAHTDNTTIHKEKE